MNVKVFLNMSINPLICLVTNFQNALIGGVIAAVACGSGAFLDSKKKP